MATGIVAAKTRMPVPTGLDRPRLTGRLADICRFRASLVLGPAGYGKTTLLAHLAGSARAAGMRVGWYQAYASEASSAGLLNHLFYAHADLTREPQPVRPWQSVEDAVLHLEADASVATLLVVDDLHVLSGTPAEAALEQLIWYLPSNTHLLIGSRTVPAWNMSKLRLSDMVIEFGAEDLRFRLWEVDRLFREHYGQPLAPEECAELERRTEGWVGGLALFHLATRERSRTERGRVLSRLADRPRLVRDYLAQNVLAGLPADLHDFMIRTSVLGCLNGSVCDRFLDRHGSEAVLEEIEKRQIFLTSTDDGETWRFHEVLRSLLESVLVEGVGEEAAKTERERAGRVLEAYGAWPEALHAYCRAENWEAVRKLLVNRGEELMVGELGWLDVLPPSISAQDPWILLAVARRHLATGRWSSAIDSYRRAEEAFLGQVLAARCQRERLAVAAWFSPIDDNTPTIAGVPGWVNSLRRGLRRLPPEEESGAGADPAECVVLATLALLAGRTESATSWFGRARRDGGAVVSAVALAGEAISDWLAGRPLEADRVSSSVEALRVVPVGLVAAVADAAVRRDFDSLPGLLSGAEKVWPAQENPWLASTLQAGMGLTLLAQSLTTKRYGPEDAPGARAVEYLLAAGDGFDRLGSQVLKAWSLALAAGGACLGGDDLEAAKLARSAVQAARLGQAPGAHLLALRVLAHTNELTSGEEAAVLPLLRLGTLDVAGRLWAQPTDPPLITGHAPRPALSSGAAPTVEIVCFGRFGVSVNGTPMDLAALRPKARSLLRWLATLGGEAIHRETILAQLWPAEDTVAATRKLHVTVTSLRQFLATIADGEGSLTLVREDQMYSLGSTSELRIDVTEFGRRLAEAASARVGGNLEGASEALEAALSIYAGDLLPEEGLAEWAIPPRERFRLRAAEATSELVDLLGQTGAEPGRIAAFCERGLRIDRYTDALWRRLVDIHERQNDAAKASHLRAQYREMLTELGIDAAQVPPI